jgi:hypothetical protein
VAPHAPKPGASDTGRREVCISADGGYGVPNTRPQLPLQGGPHHSAGVLRAELIGSDTATACNLTVRSPAPVLELSRKLVEVGLAPTPPLYAYRAEMLCIVVRAIGEAAGLRVATHGVGFEPLLECTAGPPVRPKHPAGAVAAAATACKPEGST